MTSDKDVVEMTIGKGGQYEAHLDVDDKTSFVIKNLTLVIFLITKLVLSSKIR